MKILVNENMIQAGAAVNQANDTAAIINGKLTPALEALGIQITEEVMRDCLLGATQTRQTYFEGVAKDIKATRTPSIRKQAQEAADEAWELFERDLSHVKREARNYKFLTIEGGKCTLNPDNEEKLRDSSRIYITDPNEIKAYNLHVEIIEKLNELFKGAVPYRWFTIFPLVSDKIERNDETDYSKFI